MLMRFFRPPRLPLDAVGVEGRSISRVLLMPLTNYVHFYDEEERGKAYQLAIKNLKWINPHFSPSFRLPHSGHDDARDMRLSRPSALERVCVCLLCYLLRATHARAHAADAPLSRSRAGEDDEMVSHAGVDFGRSIKERALETKRHQFQLDPQSKAKKSQSCR